MLKEYDGSYLKDIKSPSLVIEATRQLDRPLKYLWIDHIQDAGHGWLSLPAKALKVLGLSRKDFSGFSFFNEDAMVFAEEDLDAGLVILAARQADICLITTHLPISGRSSIRLLPRCGEPNDK